MTNDERKEKMHEQQETKCSMYCQPERGLHSYLNWWTGPEEWTLEDIRNESVGNLFDVAGNDLFCIPVGTTVMIMRVDEAEAPAKDGRKAYLMQALVLPPDIVKTMDALVRVLS